MIKIDRLQPEVRARSKEGRMTHQRAAEFMFDVGQGQAGTGSGSSRAPEAVLDLRHLRCPLPVLRTRKALRGLAPGAVILVQCTDPLAGIDIPHLLNQTGDLLLASERRDDMLVFTIEKRHPVA